MERSKKDTLKIIDRFIPKKSNLSSYTLPIANIAQANNIYIHEKIFLCFISIIFYKGNYRNNKGNKRQDINHN